ncbi:hypothetical protein FHS96_003088 [Sphingomonas zeicaulis]|uniref:hypothetical protein n=1 Tax=Sphingomonas zeicaulis TaxID=1632740 RepID=UPI003D1D6FC3
MASGVNPQVLDPLDPLPDGPLSHRELLLLASAVVQRRDCNQFIEQRVRFLVVTGDPAGVMAWKAIAAKVVEIRNAPAA